jgi:hypothetical protein
LGSCNALLLLLVDEQQLTVGCVTGVVDVDFFLLPQHPDFFGMGGSVGCGVGCGVGGDGTNSGSSGELISCFGAIGRKTSIFIFFLIPA